MHIVPWGSDAEHVLEDLPAFLGRVQVIPGMRNFEYLRHLLLAAGFEEGIRGRQLQVKPTNFLPAFQPNLRRPNAIIRAGRLRSPGTRRMTRI